MDLGNFPMAIKWAQASGSTQAAAEALQAQAAVLSASAPDVAMQHLLSAVRAYRRAKNPLAAFMLMQQHPKLRSGMTPQVLPSDSILQFASGIPHGERRHDSSPPRMATSLGNLVPQMHRPVVAMSHVFFCHGGCPNYITISREKPELELWQRTVGTSMLVGSQVNFWKNNLAHLLVNLLFIFLARGLVSLQ